jgi:hypothetical protein
VGGGSLARLIDVSISPLAMLRVTTTIVADSTSGSTYGGEASSPSVAMSPAGVPSRIW